MLSRGWIWALQLCYHYSSGRTLTFSDGFEMWLGTPEFSPAAPEALRSILECLHWGTHICDPNQDTWAGLNAHSCQALQEDWVPAFNTCVERTTLHLQKRLGMHIGGIKHVHDRRGESFYAKRLSWLSCPSPGEGLVEIPNKRKHPSLALS